MLSKSYALNCSQVSGLEFSLSFFFYPQWKDDAHMYILAGFSTAFTLLFFFEVNITLFVDSHLHKNGAASCEKI